MLGGHCQPDLLEEITGAVSIQTRTIFTDPHFVLEWEELREERSPYSFHQFLQGYMGCTVDGMDLAQQFFDRLDPLIAVPVVDVERLFTVFNSAWVAPASQPLALHRDFLFDGVRDTATWRAFDYHPLFRRAYRFRFLVNTNNGFGTN
jgi:hypothetical protein